jgi:hypothetical protein
MQSQSMMRCDPSPAMATNSGEVSMLFTHMQNYAREQEQRMQSMQEQLDANTRETMLRKHLFLREMEQVQQRLETMQKETDAYKRTMLAVVYPDMINAAKEILRFGLELSPDGAPYRECRAFSFSCDTREMKDMCNIMWRTKRDDPKYLHMSESEFRQHLCKTMDGLVNHRNEMFHPKHVEALLHLANAYSEMLRPFAERGELNEEEDLLYIIFTHLHAFCKAGIRNLRFIE